MITLMSDGVKAKTALEAHAYTASVERIIEANTLLSGIGFESGGLAGAHAIHNGLTVLEECQSHAARREGQLRYADSAGA